MNPIMKFAIVIGVIAWFVAGVEFHYLMPVLHVLEATITWIFQTLATIFRKVASIA